MTPTLRQDDIGGQENTNHFWQMSVSTDGGSIDPLGYQDLSFNYQEADFFPSVYFLLLLCWTYLLNPPPRAIQNKGSQSPWQPLLWLKSLLPCCTSGFSWDSAPSPTSLALCVMFSKLLSAAVLSVISTLHFHAFMKVQCCMCYFSGCIPGITGHIN